MKFPRRFLAAFAAALGLASSADAQLVADLQSPFSVALKLTTTTSLNERPILGGQELSTRFQTVRFTTRDLLADLIADGRIVGPIRGWRIVARTTTEDVFGVAHRLYATKAGQPDHALDTEESRVLALALPYEIHAFRVRIRNSALVANTSQLRFAVDGIFTTPALPLDLAGIGALRLDGREVSLGEESALLLVPRSLKLSLTGGGETTIPEEGAVVYVVEGTLNFGAHRITSIRGSAPAE